MGRAAAVDPDSVSDSHGDDAPSTNVAAAADGASAALVDDTSMGLFSLPIASDADLGQLLAVPVPDGDRDSQITWTPVDGGARDDSMLPDSPSMASADSQLSGQGARCTCSRPGDSLLQWLTCSLAMTVSSVVLPPTESPRSSDSLQVLRERLQACLFREMPVPAVVFMLDDSLRVVDVNADMEIWSGHSRSFWLSQERSLRTVIVEESCCVLWGGECRSRRRTMSLQVHVASGAVERVPARHIVIRDSRFRMVYGMLSFMPRHPW